MSESCASLEKLHASEVYARSLGGLRKLGSIAAQGFEIDRAYQDGIVQNAWQDFWTATEENVATDSEHGDKLVFEPMRARAIVDGKVRSADGQPVFNLVRNGLKASIEASKTDPRMAHQAVRDEGDVLVAGWVDSLEVGEMLALVSKDPADLIDSDSDFWEGVMGYRKGMSVFQVYYKLDDTTMLCGAYAVKRSDKEALRVIMAELGRDIPKDIADGMWTRYAARLTVTPDQAVLLGSKIRARHRELTKDTTPEYSTSEFMQKNTDLVQEYFTSYIRPLATALATGRNTEEIQLLAGNVLNDADNLDSATKRILMKVSNSVKIDEEGARTMEQLIRYALVEELRKRLPDFMHSKVEPMSQDTRDKVHTVAFEPARIIYGAVVTQHHNQQLRHQMAMNIVHGVNAGRAYGGCTPATVSLNAKGKDLAQNDLGLQDIFGGIEKDTVESKLEDCEFVSEECPKCHDKKIKTVCKDGKFYGECGCVSD